MCFQGFFLSVCLEQTKVDNQRVVVMAKWKNARLAEPAPQHAGSNKYFSMTPLFTRLWLSAEMHLQTYTKEVILHSTIRNQGMAP